MGGTTFVKGDHNVICDVCGFKLKASQTKMRWDGARVCHADWEPRQPQDFIRARPDRMSVPNPRPDTEPVFVGTVTPEDL